MLISILLPALNKARESANALKCASNAKQIATMAFMYTQANRGWLPPVVTVIDINLPTTGDPLYYNYLPAMYAKESPGAFMCPSVNFANDTGTPNARGPFPRLYATDIVDLYYSFAVNFSLPRRAAGGTTAGTAVNHPYFNIPTCAPVRSPSSSYYPFLTTKIKKSPDTAYMLETRTGINHAFSSAVARFRFQHGVRKAPVMNVVFCDGHVEARTSSQIIPPSVSDKTTWPAGFRDFWFGRPEESTQLLF